MAQTIYEDIANATDVMFTGSPITKWSFLGNLMVRLSHEVSSVPVSGAGGYESGHVLILRSAANGQAPCWVNIGTKTSCLFVPFGPVIGYGVAMGGNYYLAGGAVTETIKQLGIRSTDVVFADYSVTNDTDVILQATPTDGKIGMKMSADPSTAHELHLSVLRSGIVPDYDIFAAGIFTTAAATPYAGTVTNVLAGDLVQVCSGSVNTGPRTIALVAATANTVTVTLSAAPTAGDKINYVVFRPRGSFKPSHYVYAAGVHTTVADGGGSNDITITGGLATDVPIVNYHTTDDTDTITTVTAASGKVTVVMSANPGTTHKLAYMTLRAY